MLAPVTEHGASASPLHSAGVTAGRVAPREPLGTVSLDVSVGVFTVDQTEPLSTFFGQHGFAILRGLFAPEEVAAIQQDCDRVQTTSDQSEATSSLTTLAGDAIDQQAPVVVNHVTHVTRRSELVRRRVLDPVIVSLVREWIPEAWLLEGAFFGVVYQDARNAPGSGYSRIGWHTDWQSGPHLDRWPAVAVTIHLDPTSAANGFLRVVPGSHLWATPAPYVNANRAPVPAGAQPVGGHTSAKPPCPMPLTFGHVPGEIAVYCKTGDVLFHDAYLWHSASEGTDDDCHRRHLRAGWYSGVEMQGVQNLQFVKNAAR